MPAGIAEAKALRVQGADADITDLTLHDGRKLKVELGGTVLPTPTLRRTIEGASSIDLTIYDADLDFLSASLLSEKFDVKVDGLWFRYVHASKAGKQLTLEFEDRDVAIIREAVGPVKAFREEMTRAEFVKKLVNAANPRLKFYCPQLHVKQPIEKASQGKKAKKEADEQRGKGIGDGASGRVKGKKADAEQTEIVDRALRVAERDQAPLKARIALVAALIAESECRNLNHGDSSSVGVLQLLDIHGPVSVRMDVEHCVHLFLTEGFTGQGSANSLARRDLSPAEIATKVQGNRDGASTYAPYISEARDWVESFDGGEAAGTTTVKEPFVFEVKENETFWAAIQRLAKEVNWRAFVVAGRFFFVDEEELLRGKVRLAIDRSTRGIEDVDFDWDANLPATEVEVHALMSQWSPPPAAVVTLAEYGPASIGFGTAEPKANKKGEKKGISGNRKASTGEGKARYLVSSIEVPLTGDSDVRQGTIKLKKATAPLPEPANATKTVGTEGEASASSGGSNPTVERMRKFAEGEIGKPYIWGGFGPTGYDCSGFVSKVLNVGGLLSGRRTTLTLAGYGEAGEGELVTIHDKARTGDPHTEHVLIELEGVIFECGGISGGVGKPDYSASQLAEFSTKRHPKNF